MTTRLRREATPSDGVRLPDAVSTSRRTTPLTVEEPDRTNKWFFTTFFALCIAFAVVLAVPSWIYRPTVTRVPASCQTAVNQTAMHLQQLIDIHGSTGITVPLIRQDETALLTSCGGTDG